MYFTTSTCKGGTDGDCKAVKLYPSELHGRDCENVFTPTFGGVLQLRTDPAMNKGTAVMETRKMYKYYHEGNYL